MELILNISSNSIRFDRQVSSMKNILFTLLIIGFNQISRAQINEKRAFARGLITQISASAEPITKNEEKKYYFKVPSLRNIDKTYPYFHDSNIWDLKEAIAIIGELQLGKKLTSDRVNDIESLLQSLTEEVPTEVRYLPLLHASTAGTDRPILN